MIDVLARRYLGALMARVAPGMGRQRLGRHDAEIDGDAAGVCRRQAPDSDITMLAGPPAAASI